MERLFDELKRRAEAAVRVVSGEADFSQADPMYVPIAREKGGKVKVVAQVVGRIAVWAVSKNPEIKDASVASLRGRKIVTHPKAMTAFVFSTLPHRHLCHIAPKPRTLVVLAEDALVFPAARRRRNVQRHRPAIGRHRWKVGRHPSKTETHRATTAPHRSFASPGFEGGWVSE